MWLKNKKEHLVSLPVAAIARGTIDTALNSGIILFTGVLILVYMIAAVLVGLTMTLPCIKTGTGFF